MAVACGVQLRRHHHRLPSLVSDFFGLNNLTKNYGVIYLGFGLGSIIGSIVASLFGGFMATFNLILVLLVVAWCSPSPSACRLPSPWWWIGLTPANERQKEDPGLGPPLSLPPAPL